MPPPPDDLDNWLPRSRVLAVHADPMSNLGPKTGYLDIGRADIEPRYGAFITFDRLTPPTGHPDIGVVEQTETTLILEKWAMLGWKVVSGPEPIECTDPELLTELQRFDNRVHSICDMSRYVVSPAPPLSFSARKYTPELLAADAGRVREAVALVLTTLPAWPRDRRELGQYMGDHPSDGRHPDEVYQAATIFRDLAYAMEGKPPAEEPL